MDKNTFNIALCDDISTERQKLKNSIDKYMKNANITYETREYNSGEELLTSEYSKFDIVFLDIFMDELNGIETAKRIKAKNENAHIIFCSTSNEFAAESYNVSAFYYLIKPIDESVLFSALDKFVQLYYKAQSIEIKVGRDSEIILVTDIIYAEAQGKKLSFILKTRKSRHRFCSRNLKRFFPRQASASQYAMPSFQWTRLSGYRLLLLNFQTALRYR